MIQLAGSEHGADRTRDCLDPWKMALVKADGSVALCCWGENVGSIRDGDLDAVLRGPRASERRSRLLSGRLGEDCLSCPARGWTSTTALRERLVEFSDTERQLAALRGHARTLETELGHLRPHAATLADELEHVKPHAQTLEVELARWKAHAATLEAELAQLRPHAATLAADLARSRTDNAAEIERWRTHGRTLADDLERRKRHASTIEADLAQHRLHVSALTRALSTGVPGWWRRMTGPVKRLLGRSKASERAPTPIRSTESELMRGCVENLRIGDERCEIGGWAFPLGDAFDELRLHVDGKDLGPLTRVDRDDVAAEFRHLPQAIRSGFSAALECPPSTADWRNVRVVGSRAGVEIAYLSIDVPGDPRVLGPTPPVHLMDRVAHITNPDLFRLDGLRAATEVVSVLARHGIAEPARVLDWGCGCGRVLAALRARWSRARMVGVDVDREAIEWMRGVHPGIELDTVAFDPPVSMDPGVFDVILGLSVMTHLDRARQVAWLEELTGRLAPDGVLVLSVHGPRAARITGVPGVPRELETSGISDATRDSTLNGVVAAGEYRATFQTEAWTRGNWRGELEIVEWIVGGLGGFQDLVVLRRRGHRAKNGSD